MRRPSLRTSSRSSLFLALGLWPLVLSFTSCSPTYVLRAGYEEARILWRRQPIERLLQDPAIEATTRTKLETVLAAREFARNTLHLRVDHSYATFAQVDADQVVHVVSAAYRDRLEPYTWWFPIIGRVPYKGFFSPSAAAQEASALEHKGYDTFVRPAVAFSTLGWFADPLPSNLLRYDRAVLASVVIHELLHSTSYLAGRADFDESFATFVGDRGALEFFAARNDTVAVRELGALWADALQFSQFMGQFTGELRTAYAAGLPTEQRQDVFTKAQSDFNQLRFLTHLYADFGAQPLNNAVILHYAMYADRLQLFEDLYRQQNAEVGRTIEVVLDALKARPDDPFAAVQTRLQAPAAAALLPSADVATTVMAR